MSKRNSTLVICFLMFCSSLAFAGGDNDKKNIVKWNVAELLLPRTITLGYERVLQDNMSLNTNVCFINYSADLSANTFGSGSSSASASVTIFGVTPELRFYPSGKAPHGFYVGPYLTYKSLLYSASATDDQGQKASGSISFNAIGGGAVIGYQFIFGDVFVLDLNSGFGYYNIKSSDLVLTFPDNTNQTYPTGIKLVGVTPILGISLGAAF